MLHYSFLSVMLAILVLFWWLAHVCGMPREHVAIGTATVLVVTAFGVYELSFLDNDDLD